MLLTVYTNDLTRVKLKFITLTGKRERLKGKERTSIIYIFNKQAPYIISCKIIFLIWVFSIYPTPTSFCLYILPLHFSIFLWQWMGGGQHGVNGPHVEQSVPTGAGETAPHQHPRTAAETVRALSCSPRTAQMGCVCRVSESTLMLLCWRCHLGWTDREKQFRGPALSWYLKKERIHASLYWNKFKRNSPLCSHSRGTNSPLKGLA